MNILATTKVTNKASVNAGYEAAKVVTGVAVVMAALIGIWGLACLVSGIAGNGLGGLVKGYLTAVMGG